MSRRDTGPFHIYRCYDADDRLIYVGCTAFLFRRLREHGYTSWWAPQVKRVTAKLHPGPREKARLAERLAILKEQPRWNNRIRGNRKSWTPAEYADYIRGAIPRRSHAVNLQTECRERFGVDLDLSPYYKDGEAEVAS